MQRLAEDLDLFRSSMCLALLYRRTPMKTTDVPRPDRKVTGLPNMMTDSQMSRTRLAVLATLEMANMYQGGCRSTEEAFLETADIVVFT